jgi:hypothetical protein
MAVGVLYHLRTLLAESHQQKVFLYLEFKCKGVFVMAQRRMFNKTIVGSASFIKMPQSSQALYFHLAMHADDDGIVEAFPIMRMVGASEDDLKILVAKKFITVLNEDLVSFVNDWLEHNLIRPDRKVDSKYKNLLVEMMGNIKLIEKRPRSDNELRNEVYRNSSLGWTFNRKICKEFEGDECPVCQRIMYKENKPSVQHNVPISKGGVHEIDNISIICTSCNSSINDFGTDKLNNDEVKVRWNKYLEAHNEDSARTARGQREGGIGEVRLGKEKISCPSNDGRESDFEKFWNKYPRKSAKKKAQTSFKKHVGKLAIILSDIECRLENVKPNGWLNEQTGKIDVAYIPLPATYLNQERWEDEFVEN